MLGLCLAETGTAERAEEEGAADRIKAADGRAGRRCWLKKAGSSGG